MINLIDQALVFFDKKTATATENSGWKDIAKHEGAVSMHGQPTALALIITLHGNAVDDDNYQWQLNTNDAASDGGAATLIDTGELPAAKLTKGTVLVYPMPKSTEYDRYYKLITTVHGSSTASINYSARIGTVDTVPHTPQHPAQTGY